MKILGLLYCVNNFFPGHQLLGGLNIYRSEQLVSYVIPRERSVVIVQYWTPLYLKSWIKSLIILDFIRNLKSLSIPNKNKHLIYAAQLNNIYYFKQRAIFDRYRHFKYGQKS
jgi:hypothetical protein